MATLSIVDQIMELEAKKQQLISQAKSESLAAAEKAVADLNNLGFHYRLELVDPTTPAPRQARTSPTARAPRTGGASDSVLNVLRSAPDGLSRAAVLEQMQATESKAITSVTNSLSNLKKKGQLTLNNGIYKAV